MNGNPTSRRGFGLAIVLAAATLSLQAPIEAMAQQEQQTNAPRQEAIDENLPYEVLLLKGNLARGRRQFSVAERYFAAAARKPEATPQVFTYWARMLRDQGDLNRAMKVVAAGRKRFPESSSLRFEQGFLLLFAERYDEVRALLDELTEAERTHPFARYIEGRLLLETGHPREAIEPLTAAASQKHIYQEDALALLAEAHAEAGDYDAATEALQKAIAIAPSARQKAIYQERLQAIQASKPPWFTLNAMAGLYWDTNVNLAPLLFASSQVDGARLALMLNPQLRLFQNSVHRLHLGATLNQTLHVGQDTSALNDFNATIFGGSLLGNHQIRETLRIPWQVRYDSTYLFFRPSGTEKHFSERWSGGPRLQVVRGKWLTTTGLNASWSRFYADNQIGTVDDRSTETIDLQGLISTRYTINPAHALTLAGSGSRNDARGRNFDNFGLSGTLSWDVKIASVIVTTGSGFNWIKYPDNQDGRNDQIVSASLRARMPIGKQHVIGASIVYDENISDAADIYAYRRFVLGIIWQGQLLKL